MGAIEGSEVIFSTKKRLLRCFAPRNDIVGQLPVPVFIIPTGPLSPAHKRDIGLASAKGEIIAFIDDDAYPVKDWLKNALAHFSDNNVAAVGGPAVTPPCDNLRQAASGAVYSSVLVSGKFVYRYLPKAMREVDDYPSCNFLVKKSVMTELGGFNTSFWPGEDTKLCLEITKRLGKRIVYDPAVLVYHHRRQLFLPHLKQIANYALHRGYFVKKYPETSLKLAYFIPSMFIFAVVLGAAFSIWFIPIKIIYIISLLLYLLLVFIFSVNACAQFIPFVIATPPTAGDEAISLSIKVMRQSTGEIPGLSLRANALPAGRQEVSEAIPTEIASSPSAPRNDRLEIPPFTDRLPIKNDLRLLPYVFLGIIITHFAYGIFFMKGLLSRKLKEEL